jgi:hypothetical protein
VIRPGNRFTAADLYCAAKRTDKEARSNEAFVFDGGPARLSLWVSDVEKGKGPVAKIIGDPDLALEELKEERDQSLKRLISGLQ